MKIQIIVNRIVLIIVFLLVIILGVKFADYCIDDRHSYTRIMLHELYGQDNIDILFLGASQGFKDIRPDIIKDITGEDAFVASTSSQSTDVSLAILKEASEMYDIKKVVFDCSAGAAKEEGIHMQRGEENPEQAYIASVWFVSDYLKTYSKNRIDLILNGVPAKQYINSFSRGRRKWEDLLNFSNVADTLKNKNKETYQFYCYDNVTYSTERYTGLGHVDCDWICKTNSFYGYKHKIFDVSMISEDYQRGLINMMDYCSSNDIELILVSLPITDCCLSYMGNYDVFASFISNIAVEHGYSYRNLNLVRNEYFDKKQELFYDENHMNKWGAEAFSQFLGQYLNGKIPESAFYNSVRERLSDLAAEYYGIGYLDIETSETDGSIMREYELVTNKPDSFTFKIELVEKTVEGGTDVKKLLIQDFDSNRFFSLSQSDYDGYKIVVSYRDENGNERIIEY